MKTLRIICEANVPNIDLLNRIGYDVYYDEKNDVYSMEKKEVVFNAGTNLPWAGGSGSASSNNLTN